MSKSETFSKYYDVSKSEIINELELPNQKQGGVNTGDNRRDTMNTIIQTEPIF